MKRFLLILLVLAAGFAYTHRYRLFVRDPLGSVQRAGVPESGAEVYVNYGNDVLIEGQHPQRYLTLLQHDQPVAAPRLLKCLQFLVCLTSASPELNAFAVPRATLQTMTSRQVRFVDEDGREVVVQLR